MCVCVCVYVCVCVCVCVGGGGGESVSVCVYLPEGSSGRGALAREVVRPLRERAFFIDNLLVRIQVGFEVCGLWFVVSRLEFRVEGGGFRRVAFPIRRCV